LSNFSRLIFSISRKCIATEISHKSNRIAIDNWRIKDTLFGGVDQCSLLGFFLRVCAEGKNYQFPRGIFNTADKACIYLKEKYELGFYELLDIQEKDWPGNVLY
jgi:hypothetical protein